MSYKPEFSSCSKIYTSVQPERLRINFFLLSFRLPSPHPEISMASSTSETLVVIGSGPGIGVSTASLFALRKFNKVALISRDKKRLEQDRKTVLSFLSSRTDKKVEVKTWSTNVIDSISYKKVLGEVGKFGEITCVVFNPARVEPSELFTFDENEIVKDFMVSVPFHHSLTSIRYLNLTYTSIRQPI
jgi:short-subunit dehydrogenase